MVPPFFADVLELEVDPEVELLLPPPPQAASTVAEPTARTATTTTNARRACPVIEFSSPKVGPSWAVIYSICGTSFSFRDQALTRTQHIAGFYDVVCHIRHVRAAFALPCLFG